MQLLYSILFVMLMFNLVLILFEKIIIEDFFSGNKRFFLYLRLGLVLIVATMLGFTGDKLGNP